MALIIIVIIVICIVVGSNTSNSGGKMGKGSNPIQEEMSIDSPGVSKKFSNVAIKFFDGFLSLCKAHQITGHAYVQEVDATNQSALDFVIFCEIFNIDGEPAADVFDVQRRIFLNKRNSIRQGTDDVLDCSRKIEEYRDSLMRNFFQCEDLFYSFCEVEEYEYNESSVVIKCNYSIFRQFGDAPDKTFCYIKQELLKAWPRAKVEVGKHGMTVS